MSTVPPCVLFLVMLWGIMAPHSAASQPVIPEYWNMVNKDGDAQNSGAVSLVGTPTLLWTRHLHGFPISDHGAGQAAMRSNNLAVRDGKILLIVPETNDPDSQYFRDWYYFRNAQRATYGIFALRTGELLHTLLSPHYLGGALRSAAGTMDSDTALGLVNHYWDTTGTVWAAHGSDHRVYSVFDAMNGERQRGVVPLGGSLGANSSGYFAKTESNPLLWARGGFGGHDAYTGGVGGYGSVFATLNSLKMYNAYLLKNETIYSLFVPGFTPGGRDNGVQITATNMVNNTENWTYIDPGKNILGFGNNHTGGAPRAMTLGDDGRMYFYGYWTKIKSGTTNTIVPDYARGVVITGIPIGQGLGKARTADIEIPINFNLSTDFPVAQQVNPENVNYRLLYAPQMATQGPYVVVFQPQQSPMAHGHLFIADTVTRQVKRIDFGPAYFKTNTNVLTSGLQSTEQAVQMVITGESAYVVESFFSPEDSAGMVSVEMRVDRIFLETGIRTTAHLSPLNTAGEKIRFSRASTGYKGVYMREIAAVDGNLVALIDIDMWEQLLVVIAGSQSPTVVYRPTAVISSPVTGTALQERIADNPIVTNRFFTGENISFSSKGSIDPAGAPLAYTWDFGDGTPVSTEPHPVHRYASHPELPAQTVTDHIVTLTVRTATGVASLPTSRKLAVVNLGVQSMAHIVMPSADALISLGAPGKNYGTLGDIYTKTGTDKVYLQFDLSGVDPQDILDAKLQIWGRGGFIGTTPVVLLKEVASSWDEATLTWANAPIPSAFIAQVSARPGVPYPPGTIYPYVLEFPVTPYLQSQQSGLVSFAVEMQGVGGSSGYLFSRESRYSPQLILQRRDQNVPHPVDTIPPSTPQALVGVPQSSTTIHLSWQASQDNAGGSGVLEYRLQRDSVILASVPASELSYVDSGLQGNKPYAYTVESIDREKNVSATSAAIIITTARADGSFYACEAKSILPWVIP